MNRVTDRREDIEDRLADHILATGLGGASLRPMAAAIGTSDRMLLYYYPDKNALLAAILIRISARLSSRLDALVPAWPQPLPALLSVLRDSMLSPELAPYMRVWLEIAGKAGRNEEPFKSIGAAIARGFLAWIEARLPSDQTSDARRVLLLMEGVAMMDALGVSELANAPLET